MLLNTRLAAAVHEALGGGVEHEQPAACEQQQQQQHGAADQQLLLQRALAFNVLAHEGWEPDQRHWEMVRVQPEAAGSAAWRLPCLPCPACLALPCLPSREPLLPAFSLMPSCVRALPCAVLPVLPTL